MSEAQLFSVDVQLHSPRHYLRYVMRHLPLIVAFGLLLSACDNGLDAVSSDPKVTEITPDDAFGKHTSQCGNQAYDSFHVVVCFDSETQQGVGFSETDTYVPHELGTVKLHVDADGYCDINGCGFDGWGILVYKSDYDESSSTWGPYNQVYSRALTGGDVPTTFTATIGTATYADKFRLEISALVFPGTESISASSIGYLDADLVSYIN